MYNIVHLRIHELAPEIILLCILFDWNWMREYIYTKYCYSEYEDKLFVLMN